MDRMARLTMIGTIHRDPHGFAHLWGALKRLSPDVISVEASPYGLKYRLQNRRTLRSLLIRGLREALSPTPLTFGLCKQLLRTSGIGGIKAFIDLPYEYKASRAYAQKKGTPLYCLDLSSHSQELLQATEELLSLENLRVLIRLETSALSERVTQERARARAALRSPMLIRPPSGVRERIMAKRLIGIIKRHPQADVVHIAGWEHLLSYSGTLFDHLREQRPKRYLLASSLMEIDGEGDFVEKGAGPWRKAYRYGSSC